MVGEKHTSFWGTHGRWADGLTALSVAVSLVLTLTLTVGLMGASSAHAKPAPQAKTQAKPVAVAARKASANAPSRTPAKVAVRGPVRSTLASKRGPRPADKAVAASPRGAMKGRAVGASAPLAAPVPLMPISVRAAGGVPLKPTAAVAMAGASGASGASFGQIYGLHHTPDPLDLKSSVALVMDQDTNEVVLAKNSDAVLPIASLTKLMTAAVVVESRLPLDEDITVTNDDVDTEKNSSSRLTVGTTLTRGELLHLALMSSENRAAHALGRAHPGGMPAFVASMNAKAKLLGMQDTRFVDPTGLNSNNQSSARDLAVLVKAAYQQPLIRELSISPEHAVRLGARQVQFRNTNSLVRNPSWDIGLQKTGYIVEAGRCLVMQASMVGRKYIMIFLDSAGKYSRQADAERVRRWLERVPQKTSQNRIVLPDGSVFPS